jgi:hypothetical protein
MISCSLYRGLSNIRNKIIFKAKLPHSNINFYFWQFHYFGIFTLDLESLAILTYFFLPSGVPTICVSWPLYFTGAYFQYFDVYWPDSIYPNIEVSSFCSIDLDL